jgi:hypothetical protein
MAKLPFMDKVQGQLLLFAQVLVIIAKHFHKLK